MLVDKQRARVWRCQTFKSLEEIVVDEVCQSFAGDTFRVCGPVAPAQTLRHRRVIVIF